MMKHLLKGLLFFVILNITYKAYSQAGKNGAVTITAANTVVNSYASLRPAGGGFGSVTLAAGSSTITHSTNTTFAPGDLVMIIQMQGGSGFTMNQTATAIDYGNVTAYGNAGVYEFRIVATVPNTTSFTTVRPLTYTYVSTTDTGPGNNARAQVVKVPRYSSLTINSGASIVPTPWSQGEGRIGGIVAIEVSGTTTINGTINATGAGFNGGVVQHGSNATVPNTFLDYAYTDRTRGAAKGESIAGSTTFDPTSFTVTGTLPGPIYGRGAPANGGGGGNSHNAGGGGGSNASANTTTWDGRGFMQLRPDNPATFVNENQQDIDAWSRAVTTRTNSPGGGRGGYSYSASDQDATMTGPGATAWTGDNRQNKGGLGGRPLTVNANSRIFMGGGGGAGDSNNGTGTSGGNGGGLVFVLSNSVAGTGTIQANGNAALNANFNNTSPGGNDSPGGGGSGGTIIVKTQTLANSVTLSATGGKGGDQNILGYGTEAEGPGGGGGGGYIAYSNGTPNNLLVNGGANGNTNSPSLTEFPANGATTGGVGLLQSDNTMPDITTDLVITQTAPAGPYYTGQEITITLTATNTGPNAATNVVVTDVLPAGFTFVSSNNTTYNPTNNDHTWDIGSLAATNGTASLQIRAIFNANSTNAANFYTNTTTINGYQYDSNSSNNSNSSPYTPVNQPPVITSNGGGAAATISLVENTSSVTRVTSTDAENNSLTYSISGGVDADKFTINSSTGVLTFISPPDFEAPVDANKDNSYLVTVRVTDNGSGNLIDEQILTVNVTDATASPGNINLATNKPTTVSSIENNDATNFGGANAVDINNVSRWSSAYSDNQWIYVDLGAVYNINQISLKWEAAYGRNYQLQYSNDATNWTNFSNGTTGTNPANFSNGTVTNNTTSGVNGSNPLNYYVAGSGRYVRMLGTLRGTIYGYSLYEFEVYGTANTPPTITSNGAGPTATVSVAENTTAVTTVTAADDEGNTITYSISGGADAALFNLDPTTRNLVFKSAPNYEAQQKTFTVIVRASDNVTTTSYDEQTLTINVTNVNEPPSAPIDNNTATNTVAENSANGTLVGIIANSTDPEGAAIIYSLSNNAGGRFTINSSTGEVSVANGTLLNYEAATSHTITVQAADATTGALTSSQTFTIDVTNVNEPPVFTSSPSQSVPENTTAVTTVTTSDVDAGSSRTYTIVGGADQLKFNLTSAGVLSFITAPNFEAPSDADVNNTYIVTVRATDNGGLTTDQTITVSVTNANEPPSAPIDNNTATNTVAENSANGTLVGITANSTDPEGAAIIYSLSNNAGGRFAIDAASGVVTVANGTLLNYEATTSHTITVQAADATTGALTSSQTFTIDVTNVNEPPVLVNNSPLSINEGATGTISATLLSYSDPEQAASAITYTINILHVNGTLFKDNNTNNQVDDGEALVVNSTFTQAEINANRIRYTHNGSETTADSFGFSVSDGAGGSVTGRTFTINVTPVNDNPTIPVDNNALANSVPENSTTGTLVGITAYSTDAENTAITYSLSTNPNNFFKIDPATGVVTTNSILNYEAGASYTIVVRATDANSPTPGFSEMSFVINVTDVNEAPVFTSSPTYSVPENTTAITTVTSSDAEPGSTRTYSIVGGADQGNFDLTSGGILSFKSGPNFESPTDADGNNTYIVTVRATDNGTPAATTDQTITVTVLNANEAPVAANITNTVTLLNTAQATLISPLSGTDPDGNNTIAYFRITSTPAGGTLTINNAALTLNADYAWSLANTLRFDPDFNNASDATFTYTIVDNGGAVSPAATYTIPINVVPVVTRVENPGEPPSTRGNFSTANFSATDADGSIASFKINYLPPVSQGVFYVNGVAAQTGVLYSPTQGTQISFTPNEAYGGTTSLDYTAIDNEGAEGASTNYIVYTFQNERPVTNPVPTTTIIKTNGPTDIPDFSGSDAPQYNRTALAKFIIKSIVGTPSQGTLLLGSTPLTVGSQVVVADVGNVKFDPADTGTGTFSFTFTAVDNMDAEDLTPETYNIKLNGEPAAKDVTNVAILNTATNVTLNTGLDATDDGSITKFRITTLPGSGTLRLNGTAITTTTTEYDWADRGLLTFTPAEGSTGSVTFNYTVKDNESAEDASPATYTIPLSNNPRPITAAVAPFSMPNTNGVTDITDFSGTDTSPGTITKYVITTMAGTAAQGTLLLGTTPLAAGSEVLAADVNKIAFDPAEGGSGTFSFTFTAVDDQGAEDLTPETYNINITNNPRPITDDILVTGLPNTADALTISPFTGRDTSPGSISKFIVKSISGTATQGTLYLGTTALVVNSEVPANQVGNLKFDPATGGSGTTFTFTYTAVDNEGAEDLSPATYSIAIAADRAATYSTPNTFNKDALSNNYVLAIASDPDGTITSASVSGTALPTWMTLAANGTITVNNAGAIVAGTYTRTINTVDNKGGKTTLNVTITINNDIEAVYSTPNVYSRFALKNGKVVATASDGNGAITSATLTGSALPSFLSLNTTTGNISVNNASALIDGRYSTTVNLRDNQGGISNNVQVSITINSDLYQPNGTAIKTSENCYSLTPDETFKQGSVWRVDPISLANSFEITFNAFLGDKDTGADGIVFGFQRAPDPVFALGATGEGLGFRGITPSLAVEFDTYQNTSDPNYDHIAIFQNGDERNPFQNTTVQMSNTNTNVEDNTIHAVRIIWKKSSNTLFVYFDGALRTSYTGDVVRDIFRGDPMVYFGFTGSTGGNRNRQSVCEITFTTMDEDKDGIADAEDLDDDNDGIPDTLESNGFNPNGDDDNDGILNYQDPTFPNGSYNNVTKVNNLFDKDRDGIINAFDLDSDNDGITDVVEQTQYGFVPSGSDYDNNLGRLTSPVNANGIPNTSAFINATAADLNDRDGDGLKNFLDIDADNDGIRDYLEAQATPGNAPTLPAGTDTDKDGIDDKYDATCGCATNGVALNPQNFGQDSDSYPDYLDLNSDDDKYNDAIEAYDSTDETKKDGYSLNELKALASRFATTSGNAGNNPASSYYANSLDSDNDTVPDWLEDADNDGILNYLDADSNFYHDSNQNGWVDLIDTATYGFEPVPNYAFRDNKLIVALPVDLLLFTAKSEKNQVRLNWETASEKDNEFFIVERSSDGIHFQAIGQVKGAGTTQQWSKYQLLDGNPLPGTSYYRLTMVDIKNNKTNSPIISVKREGILRPALMAYPNPTAGELNLEVTTLKAEKLTINVVDVAGKVVYTTTYDATAGRNLLKLNLESLRSSMYLIMVKAPGLNLVQRVIKE